MKTFEGLKHGDKIRSIVNGDVLTVTKWRNEMYLAGQKDMWPIAEFDPKDFEFLN